MSTETNVDKISCPQLLKLCEPMWITFRLIFGLYDII